MLGLTYDLDPRLMSENDYVHTDRLDQKYILSHYL